MSSGTGISVLDLDGVHGIPDRHNAGMPSVLKGIEHAQDIQDG
jgi:hypothetical protein